MWQQLWLRVCDAVDEEGLCKSRHAWHSVNKALVLLLLWYINFTLPVYTYSTSCCVLCVTHAQSHAVMLHYINQLYFNHPQKYNLPLTCWFTIHIARRISRLIVSCTCMVQGYIQRWQCCWYGSIHMACSEAVRLPGDQPQPWYHRMAKHKTSKFTSCPANMLLWDEDHDCPIYVSHFWSSPINISCLAMQMCKHSIKQTMAFQSLQRCNIFFANEIQYNDWYQFRNPCPIIKK